MLSVASPPERTAPRHPAPRPKCGPKCLAWVRAIEHVKLEAFFHAVWLAHLGLPPSADTQQVMDCIKSYESGDYAESSHPSSGSGAFQFVPGTWQHWYGQWRDAVEYVGSDYDYAYQAPPLIQDAVIAYTLTHGGQGNWSPRFGNDPCTS